MSIGSAGAAARNTYVQSMRSVFENSWNPDELIREAMNARSLEKRTALAAETSIKVQDLRGESAERVSELESNMLNTEMDLQKGLRKAGLIASAGYLGAMGLRKPIKMDPPDNSAMQALIQKQADRIEGLQTDFNEFKERGPQYGEEYGLSDQVSQSSSNKIGANTPQVNAIISTANELQLPPQEFAALLMGESSMNPNVWGGLNKNHFGLIQMGTEERSRYLDPTKIANKSYTIQEQLPAIKNFLIDRGFVPGQHATKEAYRTIHAGNPGARGFDGSVYTDENSLRMMPGGDLYKQAGKYLGFTDPY